jgi:hypothetical protein
LQGEACRAIVNLSQDDVAKKKINDLGGFQRMLQSQKQFEFKPAFWEMRWGMKQLEVGDDVMVNYHGRGRWCSGKITHVNKGNGAYDVSYAHGGNDGKVPAQMIRPKDTSDIIEEFVAVWQWKPDGKLTQDELTLKADGYMILKSQGTGAAGTWNVAQPKDGGKALIKLAITGGDKSIDMERISLTTLRATNGSERAVLKDEHDDCLYVEYFSFGEGILQSKAPVLLGRKPDVVRREQQISWTASPEPWTGLPDAFAKDFATRWKGLIEISKMGDYIFTVNCETGATMYLNDKLVLTAASGGEPATATEKLIAGPTRITLTYFSKDAETKAVELSYNGPDTNDENQVVPVAVMQHSTDECAVVPKPGMIAEYFPCEYEDGVIPEGVDPDILRVEKQLDFEECKEPWQGLPKRYEGAFAARYTTYINLTCGDGKKAKYTFYLESMKQAKLYLNDKLLVQNDEPGEIEVKKGLSLIRVEIFTTAGQKHGLKLKYKGPETKPQLKDDEEMPEGADIIMVPPTVTCYYSLPNCVQPKGDPLMKHLKPVSLVLFAARYEDYVRWARRQDQYLGPTNWSLEW